MINATIKSIVFFFLFCYINLNACQCPLSGLSIAECDKYDIVFKGRVKNVVECDNKFGEAVFEIDELYKGQAKKTFKVLFECNTPCYQKFNVGDEWIIYSRYKQVNNCKLDWCSRSRKFFKSEKEDFYTLTYGNDYDDELKFLRQKLGLHRFLIEVNTETGHRNTIPNVNQTIIILLCSITVIVLFYFIFNKWKPK